MAGVDSDHSSSSTEDDDYVPSGEDESFDELEGTVEEEESIHEKGVGKQKKKGSKVSTSRRRRGWSALADEGKGDDANDEASSIQRELQEAEKEEARRKKEEAEKKRADDLWSSFLSGVNQKPKSSQIQNNKSAKSVTPSPKKTSSNESATPTSQTNGSKADSTLKITKVFDFAGEKVEVTKEVSASSKEAKNYIKEQEEKDGPAKSTTIPGSSNTGSAVLPNSPASSSKPTISSGLKRSGGGLGNVLGQIGKKQKISTLICGEAKIFAEG
ncbi:craniofacial development protein 1-like isoform X2 [Lytechinus variegatus]|uniref:craniofacial development protein 1-like isoform X2 n=1 Tax=Lytechinus variegatus TaxID=7654 RepID=UPI001BB18B3E|nr:craniofacial development protein 1-like isoform X2 [Lytechinus variegatus]